MSPKRTWPALGQEAIPADETVAIQRIVELVREKYARDYKTVRPALRDEHPRSHGCVRALFVVPDDVPQQLRHGIFSEPRTYAAWVRFSPSASPPGPDTKRDAHGVSIKLMGVAGDKVLAGERNETTQDFILANNQTFFCRNATEYVLLATRLQEGKLLKYFLGGYPWKWHVRELVNLLFATQKKISNPLQTRYWSQTPYGLGPHAAKYSARPRQRYDDRATASTAADHLEQAMTRQLAAGDASFDFMVQLQTDPRKMPVEDPTIDWSERRSPFQSVATIHIPAQDFASAARRSFGEQLSFTPWHSLPEHRPLGGINRVRGAVYDVVSKLRHEKNETPRSEPTEDDDASAAWTEGLEARSREIRLPGQAARSTTR